MNENRQGLPIGKAISLLYCMVRKAKNGIDSVSTD